VLSYRIPPAIAAATEVAGAGAATSIVSVLGVAFYASAPTAVWVLIILGWAALPLSMGVGDPALRL